jgi:hypothetical protein
MRNQAAEAGGEAINRLDILAQELMGEVKFALMRSLETPSCPAPPPPPPADCVFEEVQEEEESSDTDTDSDSDTESESESEEDEAEAEPHVTAPASVSIDDAEWDDCPSWIPVRLTPLAFTTFSLSAIAHIHRYSRPSLPSVLRPAIRLRSLPAPTRRRTKRDPPHCKASLSSFHPIPNV